MTKRPAKKRAAKKATAKKATAKKATAKKSAAKQAAKKRSAKKATARKRVTRVEGVLIVGGGYAGVHAARSVREAGQRATIIDPTGRHDFVTRLAAVAGGTAPRSDASADLAEFADAVIIAKAATVDDGVVELDDGRRIGADAVVVTAGAVPIRPPIPGLERARPLRTADDALSLRDEIKDATSVVIVGGGATGVQLAGAIASRHRDVSITLIDADDRLLAGMGRAAGRDARRILRERNVDVRLGVAADSFQKNAVIVNGQKVTGVPIWAAGFDARAGALGLPGVESGAADVDEYLLVAGWESTFAAGDVAHHVDCRGNALAMSAQIAVQAGSVAGANAARLLSDQPLRRADLKHLGWVLDLSGARGLAELGGIALTGPFLDLLPPLLHWGIDVKHLIDTRGLAGINDRPGA